MIVTLARISLCAVVATFVGSVMAQEAEATDPYRFVSTFIAALDATEAGRDRAKIELREEKNSMSAVARNAARTNLMLRTRIGVFENMRLQGNLNWLVAALVDVYRQQLEVNTALADMARTFLEGPRPGVDYRHLAASLPELTAQVEHLDETLFKATPAVFAVLIDERPDRRNHVSHLVITRAQRKQLVSMIDRSFGQKLSKNGQNWTVSSASVLRQQLLGGHKSSDDPW